jgi:hypothetical protein
MTSRPVRPGNSSAPEKQGRAAYPTDGSAALAPIYRDEHFDEPVRTRTAAERADADARAARRAADREAGRVSVESRRKLRVAPPLPVTVARAPFVALLIGLVVAGVVGILVLNTAINANQFRLNHLQSQQATLDQQEDQLNQGLAQLESPGSLLAAARSLGLVPATAVTFLTLPNGQTVSAPQPGAGH